PALVPPSPWLERESPPPPLFSVSENGKGARANWSAQPGKTAWLWVLQTQRGGKWDAEILISGRTSRIFSDAPEVIAVTAVNRCGNSSAPAVVAKTAVVSAR